MQTTPYFIVFFGLLAIIPALIVAVIALLKIEALKISFVTIRHDVDGSRSDVASMRNTVIGIVSGQDGILKRISEVNADIHNVQLKFVNVDESLNSLSNKLNSRERVDRKNRREEKEEERAAAASLSTEIPGEIPGTEQQSLFPFPQQTRRKFGSMP